MVERGVIGKNEILVHRQAKLVADIGHDLGLLDCINAQLTFEVLVEFNEVGRIAGVVHHDLDHGCDHAFVVRYGCSRSRRGGWRWCRFGLCFRSRCGGWFWCGLGSGGHRGFAFPIGGDGPWIALNAAVEVVFAVNIGHEFVLEDAHDDIVGSGESSCPSKQAATIDTLAFNRPPSHQGKGDLRAKTGCEA